MEAAIKEVAQPCVLLMVNQRSTIQFQLATLMELKAKHRDVPKIDISKSLAILRVQRVSRWRPTKAKRVRAMLGVSRVKDYSKSKVQMEQILNRSVLHCLKRIRISKIFVAKLVNRRWRGPILSARLPPRVLKAASCVRIQAHQAAPQTRRSIPRLCLRLLRQGGSAK